MLNLCLFSQISAMSSETKTPGETEETEGQGRVPDAQEMNPYRGTDREGKHNELMKECKSCLVGFMQFLKRAKDLDFDPLMARFAPGRRDAELMAFFCS